MGLGAGTGFEAQALESAPGPEEGPPVDDEFGPFISALADEWERSGDPEDQAFGSLLRQFMGRVGSLSVRGAPAALDVPTANDGTYVLERAILRLNQEEVERFRAFGQATGSTELAEVMPKHWVRKELGGYLHLRRYPYLERSTRLLLRMWDDEIHRSNLEGARADEAARNPRLAAIVKRLTAIWAGGEASGYLAGLDYLVAQGVRPARVRESAERATGRPELARARSALQTIAINLDEHLGADSAEEKHRRAALYHMITVALWARKSEGRELAATFGGQAVAFRVAYLAELVEEESRPEPDELAFGLLDGMARPTFMTYLVQREYYAPTSEEVQRLASPAPAQEEVAEPPDHGLSLLPLVAAGVLGAGVVATGAAVLIRRRARRREDAASQVVATLATIVPGIDFDQLPERVRCELIENHWRGQRLRSELLAEAGLADAGSQRAFEEALRARRNAPRRGGTPDQRR